MPRNLAIDQLDRSPPFLILYPPLWGACLPGRPPAQTLMAKQRRPTPRQEKAPAEPLSAISRLSRMPRSQFPAGEPQASQPQRRTTYFEAVALYERGLEALQRHDYRHAIDLLESVL